MCCCRNHLPRPSGHGKTIANRDGFTLIELLVAVALIGILATFAIPAYRNSTRVAMATRSAVEIRGLEKDIYSYMIDKGTLPNSLDDIGQGSLRDVWGNPYQYLNIASGGAERQDFVLNPLNTDFDLYSLGPDGLTDQKISDPHGLDDIVRAADGGYVGPGHNF